MKTITEAETGSNHLEWCQPGQLLISFHPKTIVDHPRKKLTSAQMNKVPCLLEISVEYNTLGSSVTKNLTFQHTLTILLIVATINFARCILFLVPYLTMQLV